MPNTSCPCGRHPTYSRGLCARCYHADYLRRRDTNGGPLSPPSEDRSQSYSLRFTVAELREIKARGGRQWARGVIAAALTTAK